ncbi:TlpA family protein disulfide reductase [Stackebrandtia nassauensis]|uniref:Alkyl hydroperoxide reductase/ Thiol specific antioxidant/ Mal allergen n=1 Tax=Stackebrandtia nassauensis (strain DSM 44728 / CIP 108903 / NRRL B-16338 / NBRC 102104 / LLR-40K-21) TaxID=446470 RepID=D3QA68_STANL|nr:TlpA disulfide reductase family protein [Stackebrandtia nassauensis]ADD40780.1 alkyl hydroperoxide reductase/ Thiol specific antioxidant/ Mal allergen [Stackebrandtia nassauensis DSM 44728]
MRLRTLLLGFTVAALTASCSSGGQTADASQDVDWDVPCDESDIGTAAEDFKDFTLECLSNGKDHALGVLDERPTVITLWATWCGPCRKEAPEFRKFHEEYGDQVNLIGVDTQDDRSSGLAFAADAGWRFPSVSDPKGSVMRARGITALPATFLIDEKGTTVATYNDPGLTFEKLEKAALKHFEVERS